MLQWLLALVLVSFLYFAWGGLFLALIYGCTLAASRLPLVGLCQSPHQDCCS